MATKEIIVCPTDFSARSDAALPWVKRLGSTGGEVHVLYVVEEPHIYASLDMGPIPIPSIDELTGNASKRLATFAAEHFAGVGKVVQAVLVGRPAEAIVAYSKQHAATLIVMTTHGYSGVRHVLLGSTTEAVLRHASCPVLSIRSL